MSAGTFQFYRDCRNVVCIVTETERYSAYVKVDPPQSEPAVRVGKVLNVPVQNNVVFSDNWEQLINFQRIYKIILNVYSIKSV